MDYLNRDGIMATSVTWISQGRMYRRGRDADWGMIFLEASHGDIECVIDGNHVLGTPEK